MHSKWNTGNTQTGKVYRLSAHDLGNVGNCWMKGRLREGDLVTPLHLCGDCFWTWQLINGEGPFKLCSEGVEGPGFRINKGITFGGYCMGTLLESQPTDEEYHLMMAGRSVHFSVKSPEQEWIGQEQVD